MALLLRAVDVAGALRWRWLLTDEQTGAPLADHQVNLESAHAEVARFADLYAYVRYYAVADRRVEDGARFVAEAGAWAGTSLLGSAVGDAIVAAAAAGPVTVRVTAPPPADQVLLWPLELAHAAGRPLAARGDVSFVYDIAGGAPGPGKAPVAGELRVLAVFSQPTETSVLALRRERYALSQLMRRLGRQRAKITLTVAQYGVTRERLREIVADGDGWDVLHLSGHGAGGVFLLEKADGSRDVVSTADLVTLLRPARNRVKLAVLSACESAADTTTETYRLLGLAEQADALEAQADALEVQANVLADEADGAARPARKVPSLARELRRELGCGVIAMRYPVTDEFAIAFGGLLYTEILGRRQPVDTAVAMALAGAAKPGSPPSAAFPAISLATPAVFATADAGIRLDVPRGRPRLDPAEQRMAYFPDEPPRFVGRAAAMARASAALAPDSGQTGILLHGMAGAGKTACALELAYRHQDAFAALTFWQAPTRDEEWASGLADFATRLDIQLADYGFTMTSHIGTEAALRAFVPRLRSMLADVGILLVLDNLETLLTAEGAWRDPRWDILITALTAHDGESRVIMTSRTVPEGLPAAMTVQPVHSLSLDEAVALARELPNLRELLHADAGPVRSAAPVVDADRDRVRRVLRLVQGHPKLMELADAAAADRDQLDLQLAAAKRATEKYAAAEQPATEESAEETLPADAGPTEHELDAFFRSGESALGPGQFLAALSAWTVTALAVLPADVRLMAEFVACLEDTDRRPDVIAANWAELWQYLDLHGDPPEPDALLAKLASAALIEAEPLPGAEQKAGGESGSRPIALRMHPGVAAAITAAAAPGVREAVDVGLAAFWPALLKWVMEREGGEDSALVVQAGLAGVRYLQRLGDWRTASILLEQVLSRDASPGVIQSMLPSLRRIVAATQSPVDAGVLAKALVQVDQVEAERLLRGAMDAAAAAGDHWALRGIAAQLFNLLMEAGRLLEALAVAEQMPNFTKRAGLGRWSQLSDEGRRLQVLGLMGNHAQVVAEVDRLRTVMATLPSRSPDEAVNPWNVREGILSIGQYAALATEEWARCLELSAEIMASMLGRGAGQHDVTRSRFNDAGPLMRLGRLGEARRLLADCQLVFENHADAPGLAKVLGTRADLESRLGRWAAAADLERAAMRLSYVRFEPQDLAISHFNLANYLGELKDDRVSQRAHRLAGGLTFRLAGMSHYFAAVVTALATEMRAVGGMDPSLPSTVAQVVALAEQTEGVRLGALLAGLEPDPDKVEEALTEILRAAAPPPN